jgi:hypothetical protein
MVRQALFDFKANFVINWGGGQRAVSSNKVLLAVASLLCNEFNNWQFFCSFVSSQKEQTWRVALFFHIIIIIIIIMIIMSKYGIYN